MVAKLRDLIWIKSIFSKKMILNPKTNIMFYFEHKVAKKRLEFMANLQRFAFVDKTGQNSYKKICFNHYD